MSCKNNPQFSETRTIEMFKPCSHALLFLTRGHDEPFKFECKQGPGVIQQFVESLEKMAKTLYVEKQKKNRYFDDVPTMVRSNVENCRICESPLDQSIENPTVLDHCHFTGVFLGWAHNECKIHRKCLKYTSICCA